MADFKSPIQTYYEFGYADAKAGKRRRVPRMYALAYSNGRTDAFAGKPSRYALES